MMVSATPPPTEPATTGTIGTGERLGGGECIKEGRVRDVCVSEGEACVHMRKRGKKLK